MSYEKYKNHRLAPDDNGCVSVLTDPEYEQVGTYPSKAAAKRAIDEMNPSSQPENQLDNDKDLRQEILYEFLNQFKEDKYLSQGNTDKAVGAIDQYTQSKLKAFAGDAEALLEYEDVERWSDPVDRQVAEECNQLKSNILKALKAIKEKYQL